VGHVQFASSPPNVLWRDLLPRARPDTWAAHHARAALGIIKVNRFFRASTGIKW